MELRNFINGNMIASQREKNSEAAVIKLMITENKTLSQVLFLEFLNKGVDCTDRRT